MSEREELQSVLGQALTEHEIHVHWKRRAAGRNSPEEYIVYALSGNSPDAHADDMEIERTSEWQITYYYPEDLVHTVSGRSRLDTITSCIRLALERAGYSVSYFDGGDFESIGYGTVVFSCERN